MTTDDTPSEHTRTQSDPNTTALIYGIVPADAHLEVQGTGRHPAPIRTVRQGSIAALVSEVPVEHSLDRAEDLQAFSNLDKVAELWSDPVHLRVVGPLAAWDAAINAVATSSSATRTSVTTSIVKSAVSMRVSASARSMASSPASAGSRTATSPDSDTGTAPSVNTRALSSFGRSTNTVAGQYSPAIPAS